MSLTGCKAGLHIADAVVYSVVYDMYSATFV